MVAELRNRRWRVRIQNDSTGTTALEFQNLAIDFNCKKSLRPEPNQMSLSVFGLSAEHRRAIEDLNLYDPKKVKGAKDNAKVGDTVPKRPTAVSRAPKVGHIRVEIEAGYVSGTSLIFRADLRRAITKHEGAEIKLEIEGEDGGRSLLGSRVIHSFPAGTSKFEVVQELALGLGLGLGNIREVRDRLRGEYPFGTAINGQVSGQLTDILRSEGLSFSVQNGVLQFRDPRRGMQTRGLLIDAEHGLVGYPERDAGGGLMVTTLLIPDVAPGQYIHLVSRDYSGDYLIKAVESKGQSYGNDWYHTLECFPA